MPPVRFPSRTRRAANIGEAEPAVQCHRRIVGLQDAGDRDVSPGRRRGRGTASSTHSRTPRRRSGRPAVCQLPGTGAEEPGVAAALRLEVARPISAPARRAPSPGSGTGLEHGEVAYRVTVMLGLFLEHHLEAAAHEVLLVWIWVRRLATTHPIELGLGELVDDLSLIHI